MVLAYRQFPDTSGHSSKMTVSEVTYEEQTQVLSCVQLPDCHLNPDWELSVRASVISPAGIGHCSWRLSHTWARSAWCKFEKTLSWRPFFPRSCRKLYPSVTQIIVLWTREHRYNFLCFWVFRPTAINDSGENHFASTRLHITPTNLPWHWNATWRREQ